MLGLRNVCVGRGDLLLAPINTTCMFGKGTCTHYYSVCLCGVGRLMPAQINTTCVFVREGGSKCLYSLLPHLCVVRRVDRVIPLCEGAGRGDLLLSPFLHVCLGKGQALIITCVSVKWKGRPRYCSH